MSDRRKLMIGLLATLVLLVAFFVSLQGPASAVKLPDGTILRVEQVTYGKKETFVPLIMWQRLRNKVMVMLPKRWAPKGTQNSGIGHTGWNQVSTIHTNVPALYIWVTRFDPVKREYIDPGIHLAELIDSHGCPLQATQLGGEAETRTNKWNATWMAFEAFPRRESQFRLQVREYSNAAPIAEFKIGNPASKPTATNWNPTTLPVTVTNGDLAFTLTSLSIVTNDGYALKIWPNEQGARDVVPTFTVTRGGVPASEWRAYDFDLYDNLGNFASDRPVRSRFLCPEESAWKLRVKFFGSEGAAGATNETLSLKGLKVPGPAEYITLDRSNDLRGVKVRVVSFAGPGHFTYNQETITQASPFRGTSSRDKARTGNMMNFDRPHFCIVLANQLGDQLLTIHATDDQGRECDAYEWCFNGPSDAHYIYRRADQPQGYYVLDLAPDAQTVDVNITVHAPRIVEFIVKPPSSQAK